MGPPAQRGEAVAPDSVAEAVRDRRGLGGHFMLFRGRTVTALLILTALASVLVTLTAAERWLLAGADGETPAGAAPSGSEGLTEREREVLLLIAEGKSNKEIADELHISIKTVKTHVSNLLMKCEAADRTQLAIYAHRKGWVKPE